MNDKEYNLLDEEWILAADEGGNVRGYSLTGIFEKAHELKCLSGEISTQNAAVMRLLIAVLYAVYQRPDGHDGPQTSEEAYGLWDEIWSRGSFDSEKISQYLESYRDRFYLFHPTNPFYQVPTDRGTEYDATKLNGELSESSNKPRLFSFISGDDRGRMEYSDAARWLLHLNSFDDTSAKPTVRGEGLPSCGAGWVGKLGFVFMEGRNLFQTLMLNLVLLSDEGLPFPIGEPVWERNAPKADERTPIDTPESPVEMLTLQSRRIHLRVKDGAVVGYTLMGGDIVEKENAFVEQMTVWRKDKDGNFVPLRHDPARQMWRDYQSLMVKSLDEGNNRIPGVVRWVNSLDDRGSIDMDHLAVSIAGVKYADKDFFVEDYVSDSLTVNRALLSEMGGGWNMRIADTVSLTGDCVRCLKKFAFDVAEVCGLDKVGMGAAGAAIEATAYREMDLPFRRWLRSIDPAEDNIDDRMADWLGIAESISLDIAKEELRESGNRALTGKIVGKSDSNVFTAFSRFKFSLYKITRRGDER